MASNDPPTVPQVRPQELLRRRAYVVLLVVGAVVGAFVAAVAFALLSGVAATQEWVFTTLPSQLGFDSPPAWWSIPPLALSGLLVALTIRLLPGESGHKPAEGFKTGSPVQPEELPGIIVASFATLALGAVLGPEAPLIAIGSGMGVLAVRLFKRDAPDMAIAVIGGAGSFAAISTLLGSPITGAFLIMEASGIGGGLMSAVLVPGLLAAGIGSLVYVGLATLTGLGTFSLALPNLPSAPTPDLAQFAWAIAIGVLAALVGAVITRGGLRLQRIVEPRMVVLLPVMGVVGGLATALFVSVTGRDASNVLFSGQDQLSPLISNASDWTVGALLLLALCKGVAYTAALSGFRGGPVFPAMFIGATGGIALSHLPGLPMIAGVAMGIGAMTVAMLNLPMTSALLVALFLGLVGLKMMPIVIVAVVVSYVLSARLKPDLAATAEDAASTPARPDDSLATG